MAEAVEVSPVTVYSWRQRGYLPAAQVDVVLQAAKTAGISMNLETIMASTRKRSLSEGSGEGSSRHGDLASGGLCKTQEQLCVRAARQPQKQPADENDTSPTTEGEGA